MTQSTEFGPLAEAIFKQKYSMNGTETWAETAHRVAHTVMEAAPTYKNMAPQIEQLIRDRKFMPGGRYLYATGRQYHQTQNCLLLRAADSSEGWASLMYKATASLMSGAGIGIDYSELREEGAVLKTKGGFSTGPIALMHMVNEAGRHIMQGGARRSAIWAGLRWSHPDAMKFIAVKDWTLEQRKAKELDFNAPAPMDNTNVSIILDYDFFNEYDKGNPTAHQVYWTACERMFRTGEPGFSVDYYNKNESLRNAPVTKSTRVLTPEGYKFVGQLLGGKTTLWTGQRWATDVEFKLTKEDASLVTVYLSNGRKITCDREHPFMVVNYIGAGKKKKVEVTRVAAYKLSEDDKILSDLPEDVIEGTEQDYGLGFVYGDGSIRSGRGDISVHSDTKTTSFVRAVNALGAHYGSTSTRAYFKYPIESKEELLTSSLSRQFIAGWFDADGNYIRRLLRIGSTKVEALHKLQESLDRLGIKSTVREDGTSGYNPDNKCYTLTVLSSSLLRFRKVIPTTRLDLSDIPDDFVPYRESHIRVASVEEESFTDSVYCCDVKVPEHSFMAEGVIISNCTEVVSEDDSDICNLGSINMARFDNLTDFTAAIEAATTFLLAGTLYSDVPYGKVGAVRAKNRRLGLGLMGIHEWLLQRGKRYEKDSELGTWLSAYEHHTTEVSRTVAETLGISTPVATRAIAPTGTIGIIAETTTGIEPIFCVAYRRRYKGPDGKSTMYQYVIDPTAKKLIEAGVPADNIEDAYTLSEDIERRLSFQSWVQGYVDQGISSTINLPPWGSKHNNEDTVKRNGNLLLKYLPFLRGITCYPDGARGGQPLVRVSLDTALAHEGQILIEQADICEVSGKGGSCGS